MRAVPAVQNATSKTMKQKFQATKRYGAALAPDVTGAWGAAGALAPSSRVADSIGGRHFRGEPPPPGIEACDYSSGSPLPLTRKDDGASAVASSVPGAGTQI